MKKPFSFLLVVGPALGLAGADIFTRLAPLPEVRG